MSRANDPQMMMVTISQSEDRYKTLDQSESLSPALMMGRHYQEARSNNLMSE